MPERRRHRAKPRIAPLLIGSALGAALAGSAVFIAAAVLWDEGREARDAVRATGSVLAAVASRLAGTAPEDLSRRVAAVASGYPSWLAVVGPGLELAAGPPPPVSIKSIPHRVDRPSAVAWVGDPDDGIDRHIVAEPIPGAPAGTGLVSVVTLAGGGGASDAVLLGLLVATICVGLAFVMVRGNAWRLARDLYGIERAVRNLAEGERGSWEMAGVGAAGFRTPVRIVDADDELGRLAWVLGALRDQVVEDLSRFRDARGALVRDDRDRLDFLAMMSHELRTPLNTILGFSEFLLDDPDGALTPGQREDVRIIRAGGEHLLALINDILDLSAIRSDQIVLALEDVDLTELCRRILDEAEGQLRGRRVHLVTEFPEEPIVVRADGRRLWRVLQNLVGNALKFTEEGEVRLAVRREGSDVDVAVRDTGPGIAPDELAAIFDEYKQVGDARARRSGTGLGLAIAQRLVEMHGGTIRAQSEPGRGSTFTVRLPAGGPVGAGGGR